MIDPQTKRSNREKDQWNLNKTFKINYGTLSLMTKDISFSQFSSVQFSSVPWPIGSSGDMRDDSAEIPFSVFLFFFSFFFLLFGRRPLWAVLAWAGMSTLWWCSSSISSADNSVAHSPSCPEGWLWKGCHSVWHAWTMQVSCLLTFARKCSCGPTRKLILPRTQKLVLCSKQEMQRSFLRHLVSKAWVLFFRVSKQGPCFTVIEEDGDDKRLVELELARKANDVAQPDPDETESSECFRSGRILLVRNVFLI